MGAKLESVKRRTYEIVEVGKEGDVASKVYDTMMLAGVIVGLLPMTLKVTNQYTYYIYSLTNLIFLFDYAVRVYTADYKMGFKNYKAYFAYIFTPMAIVDFLSLLPILSSFMPHSVTIGYFRLLRVFRVMQLLKLVRYSKTMSTIQNVLYRVKNQLIAVLLLTFAYIIASALFIFQMEPSLFNTFFDALYWATISITTIGYGDITPVTFGGRVITMISALVGVAVIALPSGIITAAYMDEIRREKTKYEK